MTRLLLILCALCVSVVQSAAAIDAGRLADAIRPVENWQGRDGRHYERGPYQLSAEVWRMHMPGMPFSLARQERPARACALKHIAWLARHLEARGVPATAFNVAAAYNAGLEGYTTGRAPVSTYDYARRVEALYDGAGAHQEVSHPVRGSSPRFVISVGR